MSEDTTPVDHSALMEELEQFRKEKERIRLLVGQIGGVESQRRDYLINIGFVIVMVLLFAFDLVRHVFHIQIPLPPMFSLELSVLLVSVKIIWMIHKGAKVEHFQFWVLNSIEFRLNDLSKHIRKIDEKLSAK
ncbi:MAG: hypothetical protein HOO88_05250 [Kiritimatiellaceae bacterium]|nr:hypothetical protein [Kiritimatiellaceae bacterium]